MCVDGEVQYLWSGGLRNAAFGERARLIPLVWEVESASVAQECHGTYSERLRHANFRRMRCAAGGIMSALDVDSSGEVNRYGAGTVPSDSASAIGPASMAWVRYTPDGSGPIPSSEVQAWAGRCRVAIFDPWESQAAAHFKKLAPSTTVLCRKHIAMVDQDEVGPLFSTGVSYEQAQRNGSWFAVDRSGDRISWGDPPRYWQMRVWDPEYRKAWVGNIVRELEDSPFDGVLAVGDLEETSRLDLPLPDLGSQTQQREANNDLFAEAGEALKAMGKMLVASVGDARRSPRRWSFLSQWGGVFEPGWMSTVGGRVLDPGTARQQTHTLSREGDGAVQGDQLAIVRTPVPEGSGAVSRSGTVTEAEIELVRYGLAAYWVFGGGHGVYAASSPDGTRGLWIPEMAWDFGDPIQDPETVVNLWSRTFTKGWVAVNLASDGRRRRHVRLPTGYLLPDGTRPPEQVVLSAHQGILLRRDF